jgi:hypothetical protein
VTTRIYLAHRSFDAPGYRANLARLRLLEAGLRSVSPELLFVRVLGRTPDDDPATGQGPSADCLMGLARRLIQGDPRAAEAVTDPAPSPATSCLPRADALWVVSPIDPDVQQQVEWAVEVGVPVALLDDCDQESNLLLGGLLLHSGGVSLDQQPQDRAPFAHPEQVVDAYWGGAEEVLGAKALPIDQIRVQNSSNCAGLKARLERIGLRIAAAGGVMRAVRRAPGWSERKERVFELHGRDRLGFDEIAEAVGYAGRDGAWKCWMQILAAIADELRSRRAA